VGFPLWDRLAPSDVTNAPLSESAIQMPPIQVSSATVTRLTPEHAIEDAQLGAPGWSAPGGNLVMLDPPAPNHLPNGDCPAVRVLLADGETLVRAGVRAVLEEGGGIVVVAEAATGRETVALAREVRPDVVLMNARLPGLGGIEATRQIIAQPELAEVEVLILGEEACSSEVLAALRAGASGLLTMDTEPAELARVVRVLAGGGMQLSPSVTRCLIDELGSQPDPQRAAPERFDELTAREREVVALVALGLTNHEIADRLVVSPATAKTHVSRSMLKLQARTRAKLAVLAYQTGFAQPPSDSAAAGEVHRPRGGAMVARRGGSIAPLVSRTVESGDGQSVVCSTRDANRRFGGERR
jgi:DNA-binding NarL/FixJ family response regulator